MKQTISRVLLCTTLLIVLGVTEDLRADVRQCIDAHSQGQVSRDEHRLMQAQEQFARCVLTDCPLPIQKECSEFLTEIRTRLPSLVVAARDAGGSDLPDAALSIDGLPVSGSLGKRVSVDPGEHVLTLTRPNGEKATERIVAQEGEQGRSVVVKFAAAPAAAKEEPVRPPSSPLPPQESDDHILELVLGGVGIVAMGAFTMLAISANQQQRELKRQCAPTCSDAEVGAVNNRYLLADLALLGGTLSLGGAAYLYFGTESASEPSGANVSIYSIGALRHF